MTAIPKAELMARLRKERKEAGLVELRLWLHPEDVDIVKAFAGDPSLGKDPFLGRALTKGKNRRARV